MPASAPSILEMTEQRRERYANQPTFKLNVEKPEEAVEFADRVVREGVGALWHYYERVVTNIAWAAGKQMVQWRQNDQNFVEDPRVMPKRPEVVPLYTNWLRQYVFLQIARLNLSNVTFTTQARTTQLADVQADVAASRFLEHAWRREELRDPHAFFENWMLFFETGAVYANPEWEQDPKGERTFSAERVKSEIVKFQRKALSVQDNRDPNLPASDDVFAWRDKWIRDELEVQPEQVQTKNDGSIVVNSGHLVINWYDALSLIEDMSVKSWDAKRFFVLIDRVPLEEMVELYPEKEADFVRAVSEQTVTKDKCGIIRRNVGHRIESPYACLECFRVILPASEKYPKGYEFKIAAQAHLEGEERKYDHAQVPIVPFFETPDSHDARPTCTFDDLMPLQRAINKTDVQIEEFIAETIDPTTLFEEGSVHASFLQGAPHHEGIKRGTQRWPEPLQKPVVPAHVFAWQDRLVEKFKEIAGLTNPSIGNPSPEARSGRAILALRESADMRSAVPSNGIANGLRRLGEQVLLLTAQFMPEEVRFEIVGETGNREVLAFSGKSFVAQSQNEGPASLLYDIRVEITDKPNPVEIDNRLELLLSAGVLDPRMNKDDILRALRDNDLSALDPSASDRDRADQENQLALEVSEQVAAEALNTRAGDNGKESPALAALQGGIRVLPGQDHGVDIRTHGRFLNKMWMQLHPIVVEYFAEHIRQHQMEQQRELAMALQARAELQQRVQPPGRARQNQASPGVRRSESQSYGNR